MLESVAIDIVVTKEKSYKGEICQEHFNELNKLWKDLQRDIEIWDVTDARLADQKTKKQNAKNRIKITIDNYEEYRGLRSIDYSEENWERIKQDKPTMLLELFMPRRLNSRNSIELWDRKIYIAKKTADFMDSKLFHAYDLETRIFLGANHDKQKLIEYCKRNILKNEEAIYNAR